MNDQARHPLLGILVRVAAALVIATVTYFLYVGWELGKLVHLFVAHPSSVSPAQRVGDVWQWWAIACSILLIATLIKDSRWRLTTARAWLATTVIFAALNWIAFGYEWWIPMSVGAAVVVALWLERGRQRAA